MKSNQARPVEDIYSEWASPAISDDQLRITILREIPRKRLEFLPTICAAVVNNLMDEKLQLLDEKKRFLLLVRLLATSATARAGDLGEVLATEYVISKAAYPIFIRRLRFKDIGNLAMRGDDFLAFRINARGQAEVLKAESKARAKLSQTVITDALSGLSKHSGRPNPHSLAFIVSRLREQGHDADAEVVEQLLESSVPSRRLQHLVFTTSGNDPVKLLRKSAKASNTGIVCDFVGLHVSEYSELIRSVFETLNGTK
jgi:Cap4 SAVED domain